MNNILNGISLLWNIYLDIFPVVLYQEKHSDFTPLSLFYVSWTEPSPSNDTTKVVYLNSVEYHDLIYVNWCHLIDSARQLKELRKVLQIELRLLAASCVLCVNDCRLPVDLFMQPFLCFYNASALSAATWVRNRSFQADRLHDRGHNYSRLLTRRMSNLCTAIDAICNLWIFVYIRFVCLNIFGACILKRPLRVQLMANGCRNCCCCVVDAAALLQKSKAKTVFKV